MLILNKNDKRERVIGEHEFEFATVRQKTISILELGPGTECSFVVLKKKKKMAG